MPAKTKSSSPPSTLGETSSGENDLLIGSTTPVILFRSLSNVALTQISIAFTRSTSSGNPVPVPMGDLTYTVFITFQNGASTVEVVSLPVRITSRSLTFSSAGVASISAIVTSSLASDNGIVTRTFINSLVETICASCPKTTACPAKRVSE